MTREIVPYKLALKLKELGFDEPCIAWYVSDSYGLEYGKVVKSDLIKDGLVAPLFQQAFRWFRDEHGHNGVVEGCKKHGFEWCIFPDMEHYIKPPNNFNTYEEAELACLDKLIDIIIKQQEQ
jgi:hypothetical protein